MLAAVLAPETGTTADLLAAAIVGLTAWRPLAGLSAAVCIAPAGLLIAPPPVHLAEICTWAFVSAWLCDIRRPLAAAPLPRAVALPAALYLACGLASWLGASLAGASGVEPQALPLVLLRSLTAGHLWLTAAEPETWTLLQTAAGLALFFGALAVGRQAPDAAAAIAAAIVVSSVALAVATWADVVHDWSEYDFGAWYLLRYLRGERFALHLADLNAAGSVYVLALLVALGIAFAMPRLRAVSGAAALVMTPAMLLTGSRSAVLGGVLVGVLLIWLTRSSGSRHRRALMRVLALVATIGAISALVVATQRPEQGTAAHSIRLRGQFLVTSARMLASAPIYGVGIGRYHERSREFMPEELRAVYSHENAHNYFAQQFAELGLLGGGLFVWLIGAALAAGRRALRRPEAGAAELALFAGTGGYILTCVTGHPLLVPEAALPFWGALGVVASRGAFDDSSRGAAGLVRTIAAAGFAAALVLGLARPARAYMRPAGPPAERGFYALETGADGRSFVWMTLHGVWHIGPYPGVLTIPLRAPEQPARERAWIVDVDVAGRRVGSYEIPADRWIEITIPIRDRSSRPFRRVDLRANQVWTPRRDLGARADDGPRSVRVGETRWDPAGSR